MRHNGREGELVTVETEAQMRARVARQQAAVASYLATLPTVFSPIADPLVLSSPPEQPQPLSPTLAGGAADAIAGGDDALAVPQTNATNDKKDQRPSTRQQPTTIVKKLPPQLQPPADRQPQPKQQQQELLTSRRSSLPFRNPVTAAAATKSLAGVTAKHRPPQQQQVVPHAKELADSMLERAGTPAHGEDGTVGKERSVDIAATTTTTSRGGEDAPVDMAELVAAAITQSPPAVGAPPAAVLTRRATHDVVVTASRPSTPGPTPLKASRPATAGRPSSSSPPNRPSEDGGQVKVKGRKTLTTKSTVQGRRPK